jgi:hypothetical protein
MSHHGTRVDSIGRVLAISLPRQFLSPRMTPFMMLIPATTMMALSLTRRPQCGGHIVLVASSLALMEVALMKQTILVM